MSTNESPGQEGRLVDIARSEAVEVELNRLIGKRPERRTDPDEQEVLWKESVRRYNARKREENRRAWCDYFERLAAYLRVWAEEYDNRAQALLEDRGRGLVRCAAPR